MANDIKLQRDRFMGFSFAAADLLIELDEQGSILFCMGASQNLLGMPVQKVIKQPLNNFVINADKIMLNFLFDNIKVGDRRGPIKIHTLKNGIKVPVQISIFKMPSDSGKINVVMNNLDPFAMGLNDPTRDDETGLLTKDAFFTMAEATINGAQNTGTDISLTMINMPDKDELDKRMGDKNAKEFKNKAASFLRAVSIGDSAASLNNNSFGLIHEDTMDSDKITEEIRNISKEYDEDGTSVQIGASTIEIDENVDPGDMSRALAYTINQYVSDTQFSNGRGASFEKQVNSQITNTVEQIRWFKNIIKNKKISYVAQEIVNIKTNEVHHHELLMRFEENVSPFQRLVFAEKVGIIHELDLIVLEQAVNWINETPKHLHFSLAVNISGASIARADFCFKMLKLIIEKLRYPKRLLIEITESAEIESLKKTNDFFKNIRAKGVKLCIDDFGAGAASLNYLRMLDVDIVKIDGSYIRESMKYGREDKILKAMINLCKSMNMEIVAEQIETKEQAKYLTELGVDYGQGYLYHKPDSVNTIINNLDKQAKKSA
ncbi:MAG: EAL domain-containing protein [Alphaproteobacteria bacterium]|nr:EAL domain-containing protein [Alphaproteobacteria bacterium]